MSWQTFTKFHKESKHSPPRYRLQAFRKGHKLQNSCDDDLAQKTFTCEKGIQMVKPQSLNGKMAKNPRKDKLNKPSAEF